MPTPPLGPKVLGVQGGQGLLQRPWGESSCRYSQQVEGWRLRMLRVCCKAKVPEGEALRPGSGSGGVRVRKGYRATSGPCYSPCEALGELLNLPEPQSLQL